MKIETVTRAYTQTARAEATAATGQRILDAFLQRLNEQWYDEITLDCVAAYAEVTVQTVIRRFGGKAGLLAEAIQEMRRRAKKRRATLPGDMEQFVTRLLDDYEKTGDVVLRLLALEERHPVLHQHLQRARGWHRKWVAKVFADDLDRLDAKSRQSALDALVIATDVYTWKLLRRDMQRGVTASSKTMKSMIRSAISANPD